VKDSKGVLVAAALLLLVPLIVIVMVIGGSTPPCDPQGGSGPGTGVLAAGGIPAEFVPLVQQAGTQCPEFPAPVIAADIQQESGFRPHGPNGSNASGYTQFIPSTWATYGRDTTGKGYADPNNFSDAVNAQARYLCDLAHQVSAAQAQGKIHSPLSVTELALAGYNAGIGALLQYGGMPPYAQTIQYVPNIMSMARDRFSQAGTVTGGGAGGAAAPGGAGVSASGGCAGAPAQVRVLALSYPGTTGPQAVDVYLPPGGGAGTTPPRAMIIGIHGGGWFFGDRHELDGVAKDAAMHGYVVVNGEYDMTVPRYPKELDDVRAEIAWARSQAGQWGGDPAKIATWGDSAGANLAVDVAATGDHAGLQAAVGWSGPYDLTALPSALTAASTDYQKLASIADPAIYTGCLPLICPAVYQDVSPAVSATPGMPATYLANSDNELVPLAQQSEMVATLTRLGVPHEAVVVPGTGHATAYAAAQTGPSLAWLDKTLGFTPPPPPTGGGGVSGSAAQQAVVAAAMAEQGLPYVWGGGQASGPTGGGFDCSGLTLFAFAKVGVTLPRVAQGQYAATAGQAVPGGFNPAAYQPGDLLFYGTASNIHHVALAIGNGQLIEAPDFGQTVSVRPIYHGDFFAATRPLGSGGGPQ